MNLRKKLYLATAAAALMSTASVSSASGLYMGGQAGWTDTHIKADLSGTEINGLSATGFSGSAFAGYQVTIPSGFMGFEANIGDSSAEYETDEINYQETITSDLSYGVSATLGIDISGSTQIYGLAGYQATGMELNIREATPGSIENYSEDLDFAGPRFGFGLQTDITKALAMRIQWTRTLYGKKDVADSTFEPAESQFSVGIMGFF